MENVVNYSNYKDFLQDSLHSKSSPRGLQSQLAKHLGCQSAYLYQVLKGSGNLTDDQAYGVTKFFGFNENQRDYFLALVRLSKAASNELREFLTAEIARRRREELDLKNQSDSIVAADEDAAWNYYFSGVLPSAIHLLTSSPQFQTPEALASKTRVDMKTVLFHLARLKESGFLIQKEGRWIHASPSYHFASDSKHNFTLQLMRRTQAMTALAGPANASHVHFSSLFTLDSKSLEKLRTMVASFVKQAQNVVHEGGTDDLYVLTLDLFAPLETS